MSTLAPDYYMPHRSRKVKLFFATTKLLLALAILGYLIVRIQSHSGFERLLSQPKNWLLLILAQGLVLFGYSLSFVRWYLLIRGLGLPFQLGDALRLGSLGYMLNQVSPGSVGGDLIKAVFIAKEHPERKTEVVATVLLDRVIGLYAISLVASAGLLLIGQSIETNAILNTMRTIVWTAAAAGTLGFLLALNPAVTGTRVRQLVDRIPLVGHTLHRLLDMVAVYHSRRRYLAGALGLALITHSLMILAFWFICQGLPVYNPTLIENASIVPLGLVICAIPLTPGGLGTLEAGFEFLYTIIGAAKGDGFIIAFAYRIMVYGVASMGACYYFAARKSVDKLIHEAEVLAEESD